MQNLCIMLQPRWLSFRPPIHRRLSEALSRHPPHHRRFLSVSPPPQQQQRSQSTTPAPTFTTTNTTTPPHPPLLPASPPHFLLFPGQGSQRPGMGKDLWDEFPQARLVFEEVDDALQVRLSRIVLFEGSESDLSRTSITQPALLAHSIAVLRVLEMECGGGGAAGNISSNNKNPLFANTRGVLGHSVGEYAALVCSGALSLADAARILRLRGEVMQASADAVNANASTSTGNMDMLGMVAILLGAGGGGKGKGSSSSSGGSSSPPPSSSFSPSPLSSLSAVLATVQQLNTVAAKINNKQCIASIAAINSPQQVVLSGHLETIQKVTTAFTASSSSSAAAVASAEEGRGGRGRGALVTPLAVKKSIRLPVSAPFHSPYMQPAAECLRIALSAKDDADGAAKTDDKNQQSSNKMSSKSDANTNKSALGVLNEAAYRLKSDFCAPSQSFISSTTPRWPLIANVSAKPVTSPSDIRDALIMGVSQQVRWVESLVSAAAMVVGGDGGVERGGDDDEKQMQPHKQTPRIIMPMMDTFTPTPTTTTTNNNNNNTVISFVEIGMGNALAGFARQTLNHNNNSSSRNSSKTTSGTIIDARSIGTVADIRLYMKSLK